MTIKLTDKSKKHIEDSFEMLFDAVSKGREAFDIAFDQHMKNLDPLELLAEHMEEGRKKEKES